MDDKKRDQLKSVVKGKAKIGKDSGKVRFSDVFLPDDITSVKDYIITDVIVPLIKTAVLNTVETFLYGGSSRRRGGNSGSRVSYRNYYDDPAEDRFSTRNSRRYGNSSSRFHNDDISFETEHDALMILENLCDIVENYGFATVQDLYDLSDATAPYTSNRYGWTNLSRADVGTIRIDGELRWILKMPKAVPIG